MKALVIGGNRFFGKRLVHRLIQSGHEVTVLNRGQLTDDFEDRVQRIRLDRTELRPDHPALGSHSWDIIYDQVCFTASEAEGACSTFQDRVGHFVFVSSMSVYDTGALLQESDFNPLKHTYKHIADPKKEYAEAKRQCETVFFNQARFPVTALRIPIVLGTDDYTERLKFHVDRIFGQKHIYMPSLKARMCFIGSEDAARFLEMMTQHPFRGPVNCSSKAPIELGDLIRQIEKITGRPALITDKESEGDPSPFGISKDWFMDTTVCENHGFQAKPLQDWLPDLIQYYVQKLKT